MSKNVPTKKSRFYTGKVKGLVSVLLHEQVDGLVELEVVPV